VYDPEKWAVVFKYTSVSVAAGNKVTFKNNATRAPVVWLVSGDVTIAGTVDLSGQSNGASINYHLTFSPLGGALAEPGPGGFRGGAAYRGGDVLPSGGFGPGGGRRWPRDGRYGTSAGFGTTATSAGGGPAGANYGNPSLIPLIGGSGAAGGGGVGDGFGGLGWGGPAGGGAILIASTKNISILAGSQVLALGGNLSDPNGGTGGGSGGGIRMVCDNLNGSGSMNAAGGGGNATFASGIGRIRLERVSSSGSMTITPAPSVIDLADGNTAQLWPGTDAPTAKIISVNSVQAPADPKASFGSFTPDVALPLVSQVEVIVETENVENASQVFVRITPRNGMTVDGTAKNDATEVAAVVDDQIGTNPLKLRWKATLPSLMGHSAIQARIIRP